MKWITIIAGLIFIPVAFAQKPDIAILKARIFIQDKNYTEALEILTNIQEKENKDILKLYGDYYYGLQDYSNALGFYIKANSLSNNSLCLEISKTYACLGNNTNTMQWLEKYLGGDNKISEYDIASDKAFNLISQTQEWKNLWKRNWYSQREIERNRLISILKNKDGNNVLTELENEQSTLLLKHEFYAFEAQAYVLLKSWNMALNSINKALELQKHNTLYWEIRGDIYSAVTDYALAVADYSKSLEIEPNVPVLYLKRAESNIKAGNKKQASADLSIYQQIYPEKQETLFELGKLEALNENYAQSLHFYTKLINLDKGNETYYYNRGLIYLEIENYQLADEDFGMALDLNPKLQDAYLNKGKIKLYLLDSDGACYNFEKAREYGNQEASKLFLENCLKY